VLHAGGECAECVLETLRHIAAVQSLPSYASGGRLMSVFMSVRSSLQNVREVVAVLLFIVAKNSSLLLLLCFAKSEALFS